MFRFRVSILAHACSRRDSPHVAGHNDGAWHPFQRHAAEGRAVNRIMTSRQVTGQDATFELGNLLSGIYSTPVTELAMVISKRD
jgi:hypothetical protein